MSARLYIMCRPKKLRPILFSNEMSHYFLDRQYVYTGVNSTVNSTIQLCPFLFTKYKYLSLFVTSMICTVGWGGRQRAPQDQPLPGQTPGPQAHQAPAFDLFLLIFHEADTMIYYITYIINHNMGILKRLRTFFLNILFASFKPGTSIWYTSDCVLNMYLYHPFWSG